ncbi:PREDICTED: LETM1 domain-containing protein 1 [Nanorana parkeri]|uniref:LETM1 domain-containing protein 1 n=1 Tax=Nanorana parkeri TaxID=125878 RepID=UPI000854E293|nr:PREDICTED: LETM1 domain-containing protein 1 [Nanorana parkeri]
MALYRTGMCRRLMNGGDRRLVSITLYQPCHLSTNQKPQSVLSVITSKARHLNARYEQFLERKFPNFYILYSTFMKGSRMLLIEAKEVREIKVNMRSRGLKFHQLTYREMEKLRQFRRDIIKAAPVVIISIPPFANYLVFVLMYFFPRQLLIRHFWTPKQQPEFLEIYHSMRKEVYKDVLESLQIAASKVSAEPLHNHMVQLFTQVQRGVHPQLTDIEAIKAAFSGPPLSMTELDGIQMKALSRILFLTPHLPAFFLQRRLKSHILEIRHLDAALLQLRVDELTDEEVKRACYIRGLNGAHLGAEACRRWLSCWIQLSGKLEVSEASLLLHSMVLLSTNYHQSIKD